MRAVAMVGVCLALAGAAHGASWRSRGPERADATAIAVDAADGTVWAGTRGGGVYRSADGGVTWVPFNAGLPDAEILALAATGPGLVYAGTAHGHVAVRDPGAAAWRDVTGDLPTGLLYAFAGDPHDPSHLLAGTGAGLYESVAGGGTWIRQALTGYDQNATAITVGGDGAVHVGTYYGGVWVRPPGLGWQLLAPSSSGLGGRVRALLRDPVVPATLYAATLYDFHTSRNGGTTWTRTTPYVDAPRGFAFHPAAPERVYAGGREGILTTADHGTLWTRLDAGPLAVAALAVDPADPRALHAASYYGTYRSGDGGLTWTSSRAGITNVHLAALAVAPSDPGVVYAASEDWATWRSDDGGRTWTTLPDTLPGPTAVTVHPSVPTTAWAATTLGVRRTTDGGTRWWHTSSPSHVLAVAVDRGRPDTVYAGSERDGVAVSRDGGGTWQAANAGLPARTVYGLAVGTGMPAVVYAATYLGMYRSTDDGQTWTLAHDGLPRCCDDPWVPIPPEPVQIRAVAADTMVAERAYALADTGAFRTLDGGLRWTRMPDLDGHDVQALVVDQRRAHVAYAGTRADGVWATADGGTTWARMPDGVFPGDVPAIAAAGTTVVAGTRGGGTFVLEADCGDGVLDPGESCDDGNRSDGDCCSSACRVVPTDCAPCERCEPGAGCVAHPVASCARVVSPGAARLDVTYDAPRGRPALTWAWRRGEALTPDGLGAAGGVRTLCVYDESGGAPRLLHRARSGDACGARPCWRSRTTGLTYHRKDGVPEGIVEMTFRAGDAGRSEVHVKARGPLLVGRPFALPAPPLPLPLRVQLQDDSGRCWEAVHGPAGVVRNGPPRTVVAGD